MGNTLKPIGGGKDDAPQIQAAMDALIDPDDRWPNEAGGEIVLSKGKYTIQTQMTVPCGGIIIKGEGNPSTIACVLEWKGGTGAMFVLRNPVSKYQRTSGFHISDVSLRSNGEGVAFAFDAFENYGREWRFTRVAANFFDKVFEVRNSKSYPGGIHCNDCRFTYNNQVLDATARPVNETRFRDCLLSKNGMGLERYAFDIRGGSNIVFMDSVIEGQPRAIRVNNTQGVTIEGCRFESNVENTDSGIENPRTDAVVHLENCRHIYMQRCFHRIVALEEESDNVTLMIKDCVGYDFSGSVLRRIVVDNKWKSAW